MVKKLLFVITQPVVGGAQRYVFDLAKHFNYHAERDLDQAKPGLNNTYNVSVAIGGSSEGDLFKKLAAEKIKTHHLKFLSREVKLKDDILAFFEILKLFRKEHPDIVHLNSSKIGFIGALAAWWAKVPKVVFTAHGWIFKEEMPTWKKRLCYVLEWLSSKFRDVIICVSQDDFDQALRHKIAPPRKLYVIYNSLCEKIKFLTKLEALETISRLIARPIPDNTVMLANLGRLYATKGLSDLIKAFDAARTKLQNSNSKMQDIFLVIFGDGPEEENLKSQISDLKLQNSVFLVGDVSNAAKYLSAFDALVLSSIKEGLPYAILEAGLAGIPVVATDVGGISEIIENEKTGILVEPKNPAIFAEAIEKLILDQDTAQKLAVNLKKLIAKKFDPKVMIEKTDWVYRM